MRCLLGTGKPGRSTGGQPVTIIMAAGDGVRWRDHLGVPKHLVSIDGETLVHRTARQANDRGWRVDVVGLDKRYPTPHSKLHLLPDAARWPTGTDADKFLSSRYLWSPDGRSIVLYGDVFFTDEAMNLIANFAVRDWTLFCRFGPNKLTGHKAGECFAQSFWPEQQTRHLKLLKRGGDLVRRGKLPRYGGWEHYRLMVGLDPKQHVENGQFVEIDDWTDDFDTRGQFDRFIRRREAARAKGRLPAMESFEALQGAVGRAD